MHKLINKLKLLEEKVFSENKQRDEIKNSEAYFEIGNQIDELMRQQEMLLSMVEDNTSTLEAVKKQIVEEMREKNLESFEDCIGKFKTKKSVNTEKLLRTIGGDIDTFVVLSDISQKKLKEFAKDNRDIKKALLGCIEVDSKELIDVTIKYE